MLPNNGKLDNGVILRFPKRNLLLFWQLSVNLVKGALGENQLALCYSSNNESDGQDTLREVQYLLKKLGLKLYPVRK